MISLTKGWGWQVGAQRGGFLCIWCSSLAPSPPLRVLVPKVSPPLPTPFGACLPFLLAPVLPSPFLSYSLALSVFILYLCSPSLPIHHTFPSSFPSTSAFSQSPPPSCFHIFSCSLSLPFVCVCPSCVFPFVCGSDPVSRYLLLCPIPAVFVSSFSSFSHSQVLFFQTLEIIHCHPQGAQWIKCLNQTRTAREASSRKRASQGE